MDDLEHFLFNFVCNMFEWAMQAVKLNIQEKNVLTEETLKQKNWQISKFSNILQ